MSRTRTAPESPESQPLSKLQIAGLVGGMFAEGVLATQIAAAMKDRFGITMSREEPYRILADIAGRGWIKYAPPADYALAKKLLDAAPWLRYAEVSPGLEQQIADTAAARLVRLCHIHSREPEFHIGFDAGSLMKKIVRSLAKALARVDPQHLPGRLVFHALVAGTLDPRNPTADPNSFAVLLADRPEISVQTQFVPLPAPPLLETRALAHCRNVNPWVRTAIEAAAKLHVLCITAQLCRDSDHELHHALDNESIGELRRNGWLGDILRQPMSAASPLDLPSALHPAALFDLPGVGAFGQRPDHHVVLALGPSSSGHSKADLLRALLSDFCPHLATDLICDSLTASEALARHPAEGPA
jgi:hypothetical protein